MQTFTVEVVSATPGGINQTLYPHWKRNIQATDVNSALSLYKQMMEPHLPNGYRYGIEITDQQGRKETVTWEKK